MLLVFVLIGAIVGGMLGLILGVIFTGTSDVGEILLAAENQGTNTAFILIIQAFSSVGMFILPPLALGAFYGKNTGQYFDRRGRLTPTLLLLAFVITLSSGPLIEWLGALNGRLSLPAGWSGLEEWMLDKEAQMEEITVKLLADTSLPGFLSNLLVIAVIAAVGEELLFRGCLQTILHRWLGNPHLAIWVVAFVFSAIHLQFYGFLPRVVLGVLFGYLFLWSKNLWVPIFAHFVNNATILIATYVYQKQGETLGTMDFAGSIPDYAYFISFVICVLALWAFRVHVGTLAGRRQQEAVTIGAGQEGVPAGKDGSNL